MHCAICVIKIRNLMRYKNQCVIQAQKYIRGYLARKQHRPRYKGIVKIKGVKTNVKQMETVANQLKNERDSMMRQMKEIEMQIDTAIKSIQVFVVNCYVNLLNKKYFFFRQIRK